MSGPLLASCSSQTMLVRDTGSWHFCWNVCCGLSTTNGSSSSTCSVTMSPLLGTLSPGHNVTDICSDRSCLNYLPPRAAPTPPPAAWHPGVGTFSAMCPASAQASNHLCHGDSACCALSEADRAHAQNGKSR